jgi:hypothetical protein
MNRRRPVARFADTTWVLCALLLIAPVAQAKKASFDFGAWLAAAEGKSVEVITWEAGAPWVYTPGNAVGTGLIDDMTKPAESQEALPDAALILRDQLLERLRPVSRAQLQRRDPPLKPKVPSKPEQIRALSDADYVLTVSMRVTAITYRPTKWATYYYYDMIDVQLFDNQEGKLLFHYREMYKPEADDEAMHFKNEEFGANGGQKVRDVIALSISRSLDRMMTDLKVPAANGGGG